ncbi:unnamed protein product, partial [Iphiclides podalirius]
MRRAYRRTARQSRLVAKNPGGDVTDRRGRYSGKRTHGAGRRKRFTTAAPTQKRGRAKAFPFELAEIERERGEQGEAGDENQFGCVSPRVEPQSGGVTAKVGPGRGVYPARSHLAPPPPPPPPLRADPSASIPHRLH